MPKEGFWLKAMREELGKEDWHTWKLGGSPWRGFL